MPAVGAELIHGDFGIELGATLGANIDTTPLPAAHGRELHALTPGETRPPFVEYAVELTAQRRIASIRARSAALPKTECYRSARDINKWLSQRLQGSGYYALDEGDMYYDGTRQAVVTCAVEGDVGRVVLEYSDEDVK